MKKLAGLFAAGVASFTLTACNEEKAKTDAAAPANAGTVHLYTWTEYVPEGLLDEFTKQTGIKVEVSSLESNETLYAKLKLQGKDGGYDVIAPSNYFVSKMAKEGMLAELDHAQLPVIQELNQDWLNKPYDVGNKYSLPQLLGAPGIAFNTNVQPQEEVEIQQTEQEQAFNPEFNPEFSQDNLDPIAPLETANARIASLEAYIAEADSREKDIQLRAQAEIQNIRRRAEQDVEKAHKFALEKFSKELLTVVDNLERGLNALDNAVTDEKTQALVDGVEMTHKELISTLAKFGVEAVGNVGEVFNPELHQAISMQPAEGIEANHISTVLQKGYTLQGRVLRPAMVMVAA